MGHNDQKRTTTDSTDSKKKMKNQANIFVQDGHRISHLLNIA